ncbi:MAG: hypothetical protein EB019_04315 [Actinobacteria bacterium]|jgi:hypothetical protein|nr:hypothetical protein [Actinomycetota bacterium]
MKISRFSWFSLVAISLSLLTSSAQASLPGIEDYSNERIVPLLQYPGSPNSDGSGFLYSSRIVFTSAHTSVTFNDKGEMIDFRPQLAVGKPNSNVATSGPGVRVVKRFAAPGYIADRNGDVNDFAILVLERDLMKIEPAQLMTPEIERELVDKRATVKLHGYGNYVDLCGSRENPPCNTRKPTTSLVPRYVEATLRPASDFMQLLLYPIPQQFADQLLFFSPGKTGMCSGDSGGSLTTIYNGKLLYLSNIGTGGRTYGCGTGGGYDGKGGFQYSPQIYKQLDLIKKAEAFVAEQIAAEEAAAKADASKNKSTITCVKGKTTKKVTAVNPKCPKGFKKK